MRLGVIGTGNMAQQMARAVQFVRGLEVVAVLSRQQEKAVRFCAACAPRAMGYQDMQAFFKVVDAVYVATPPGNHVTDIQAALAAKKPVLCEKPLTPTVAETAAVITASRQTGVPVMEAIWTLTLPAYNALEVLLRPRDPALFRMAFDFSSPLGAAKVAHVLDPKGGGVLLDRGVYGYGAALKFLGPVQSQDAIVERDQSGLDRDAILLLKHESGARSVITLSLDRQGSNQLDLATADGAARLGPHSLVAEALRWSQATVPTVQSLALPASGGVTARVKTLLKTRPAFRRLKALAATRQEQFLSFGPSCYVPVLGAFRDLLQGQPAAVPLDLSLRIAELTAEARAQ